MLVETWKQRQSQNTGDVISTPKFKLSLVAITTAIIQEHINSYEEQNVQMSVVHIRKELRHSENKRQLFFVRDTLRIFSSRGLLNNG